MPLLLASVLLTALSAGVSSAPADASVNHYGYSGAAFGSAALVGSTIVSGPSFPSYIGCTTRVGLKTSNNGAQLAVPKLISSATVHTTGSTSVTRGGSQVRMTATVHSLSLLGGAVTATMVQAVSTASANGTGLHDSAAGSQFVGLKIDGHAVAVTPPPNQEVQLPGFGYVLLNERSAHSSAESNELTVTMIKVVVTHSNQVTPVGTQIYIAQAAASIHAPVPGVLQGVAYATSMRVGRVLSSGPSAPAELPCFHSSTQTNSTLGVSIPKRLTTGTVTDTATGKFTASSVKGTTSSAIHDMNLLSGVVTAAAIASSATVSDVGGRITRAHSVSYVSLKIAGHSVISGTVPLNTHFSIPHLGTLYLNRVVTSPSGIFVEAIMLVVTQPNSHGLELGTVINVGVDDAYVN